MKGWHTGELVQAGGGVDNSQERNDGVSRGAASGGAPTGCGCPQPQDQVQCPGTLQPHLPSTSRKHSLLHQITAHALPLPLRLRPYYTVPCYAMLRYALGIYSTLHPRPCSLKLFIEGPVAIADDYTCFVVADQRE